MFSCVLITLNGTQSPHTLLCIDMLIPLLCRHIHIMHIHAHPIAANIHLVFRVRSRVFFEMKCCFFSCNREAQPSYSNTITRLGSFEQGVDPRAGARIPLSWSLQHRLIDCTVRETSTLKEGTVHRHLSNAWSVSELENFYLACQINMSSKLSHSASILWC